MSKNIAQKLQGIQTNLKAPKGQTNKFGGYKYRSAEDILEAVKPLLSKFEATLMLIDEVVEVGGRVYVKATAKLGNTDTDDYIETTAFAREAEVKKEIPKEFSFTRNPQEADFAFRRKGRRAGQIIVDPEEILQTNPNSFIYVRGPVEPWQEVNWREYGNAVMGARSISRNEIADALSN